MVGDMRRGSAADAPMSLPGAVRKLVRSTPADSPVTMKEATRDALYRDLATPTLRTGEPAFDFELPRLDVSAGREVHTGDTVRLSDHRDEKPAALIFGSYT